MSEFCKPRQSVQENPSNSYLKGSNNNRNQSYIFSNKAVDTWDARNVSYHFNLTVKIRELVRKLKKTFIEIFLVTTSST
jgi:hypothetical protein